MVPLKERLNAAPAPAAPKQIPFAIPNSRGAKYIPSAFGIRTTAKGKVQPNKNIHNMKAIYESEKPRSAPAILMMIIPMPPTHLILYLSPISPAGIIRKAIASGINPQDANNLAIDQPVFCEISSNKTGMHIHAKLTTTILTKDVIIRIHHRYDDIFFSIILPILSPLSYAFRNSRLLIKI